jgi:hypothetical protein
VRGQTARDVLFKHENAGGWAFETRRRDKRREIAGHYIIEGQTRTTDGSHAIACEVQILPSEHAMPPDVAFEAAQAICQSIVATYYSA